MKIQINGFDIEVNTEESNMSVKVLDANGKELSNNTYTQSSTNDEEVAKVDMPSVENTEPVVAQVQPSTQPETKTQSTEEQPSQPVQSTEEQPTEDTGESFIPTFETFKKLRKEGKI